MKKTIAGGAVFLLSLVFLLCLLPGGAQAAEEVASGSSFTGNVTWVLDSDGVLTISGTGEMPSDVPWNSYAGQIRTVLILPGVTDVCAGAFQACTGLTSVTLPRSIVNIGYQAFSNCQSLTDVYFGGTAEEWRYVFVNSLNDPLSSAEMHYLLGSGVCGEDLTWTLDEDGLLTVSGTGAMDDYDDYFASLSSPGGVYPEWADLSGFVTAVELQPGVTGIGSYAFSGCCDLRSVTLPGTLTAVGDYAFFNCVSLTDVYCAFSQEQWSSVSIGADNGWLTDARLRFRIDAGVCGTDLTWILYGDDDTGLLQISGAGPMDDFYSYGSTPWYNHEYQITAVELRPGVASIGYGAFANFDRLTEVSIPEGLTLIESHAFSHCGSLTILTLPGSVREIGSEAFSSCYGLRDVFYLGTEETWRWVDVGTDNECLTNAEMHFLLGGGSCGEGLSWILDEDGTLTISGTGYMPDFSAAGPDSLAPWAEYGSRILALELRPGVPNVGEYAFAGCSALRSVTIPNGLTDVRGYAFSDCTSLADVYYGGTEQAWESIYAATGNDPLYAAAVHFLQASGVCGNNLSWVMYEDGVLVISGVGDMYDYDCSYTNPTVRFTPWDNWISSITEVILRPGAASIGDYAFYHAIGLTSVKIPATVTEIGKYAFSECYSLRDVYFDGTLELWHTGVEIGPNNEPLEQAAMHCPLASGVCGDGLTWVLDGSGVLTISGEGSLSQYPGFTDYAGDVTNVVIGRYATGFSSSAFSGLYALSDVYYAGSEEDWAYAYQSDPYGSDPLDSVAVHFESTGPREFLASGRCGDSLVWTLTRDGVLTVSGCGSIYSEPSFLTYAEAVTNVVIGRSVTGLTNSTFSGFDMLSDVYYRGYEEDWANAYHPDPYASHDPLDGVAVHFHSPGPRDILFSGRCGDSLVWTLTRDGVLTVSGCGSFYSEPSFLTYAGAVTNLVICRGVEGMTNYTFDGFDMLSDLYYRGSEEDWANAYNPDPYASYDPLDGVAVHFESAGPREFLASGRCGDSLVWTLTRDGVLTVSGYGSFYSEPSFLTYAGAVTNLVICRGVEGMTNYTFAGFEMLSDVYYRGSEEDWANAYNPDPYASCDPLDGVAVHFESDGPREFLASGRCGDYLLWTLTRDGVLTVSGCGSFYSEPSFLTCAEAVTNTVIGRGVEGVQYLPFSAFSALEEICVSSANPSYSDIDGVLFDRDAETLIRYPAGRSGTYDIPEGVSAVGDYAFCGCTGLTGLTVPASVANFGEYALSGCSSLASVYYGGSGDSWEDISFGEGNGAALENAVIHYPVEAVRENETAATCTAAGGYDEVVYCACGEELTRTHVTTDPLGHDWGEWTVTDEPTCTADGVETRSCARCQESETRPVDALGHDYTAAVVAPTCTAGGCTTHTCSRCGHSYTDELTDPLGHLPGEPAHENETAPTYTEDGGYDEAVYCERCGLELSRTHVTVPMLTVEPLEITAELTDFSGPEGSTASFTVQATGTGLTYQWYVKNRTASKFSKSSVVSATYSVTLTEANSGRQLYCVVTDAAGNTARTNTVTMAVAVPLEITAPLEDYVGPEGSTAAFTVEAEGEGLSYQWYVKKPTAAKFSKSSITAATYSVELTAARNGNQVYCVVTDAEGNTARTNTVTMSIGTAFTVADLTDYVGPEGSTAAFTVSAEGEGLSYQWYVKKPTATKFSKSSITLATYSVELTAARNGNQVYCVVTDGEGNTVQTNTVSMTIG